MELAPCTNPIKGQFVVYMLRCKDNSLYTGMTNNFEKRYAEHVDKSPKGAKYTKSHEVTGIAAVFMALDRSDALKIENMIKRLSKREKETLVMRYFNNNNGGETGDT